jgi:hypothetical protein
VVGNVLGVSKWSEMFEASQTGRKCFRHVTLLRNVLPMSHCSDMF